MRAACLALAAGAWWLQQQAHLMPAEAVLLLGASASCLAVSGRLWRRGEESRTRASRTRALARRVIVVIAAFAIGFAWASWRADRRLADALPHDLEGKDMVVVGTVAVLPALVERGVRFEFTVESVETRDARGQRAIVPEHLALGWYAPRVGDASLPRIEPGQRWRLTVRLKRPHGAANPFGFDYEYWLLEEGLRATGYVRPGADDAGSSTGSSTDSADERDVSQSPIDGRVDTRSDIRTRKLADFVWSVNNLVERARSRLRDRVFTILADGKPLHDHAPYAGVIVALIVGDQRAIAQSDWIVFNRTGIGHLVSISGMHVSMLAALGAWLAFGLWRRHPAWCTRLAAHKVAALAGTSVALGYCLLAGFGVPAQRTLYMIAVVALALWTHRMSSVSRVLCIALVVVVAIDPWAVMGAGFWLSFAAVAAIFYVTAGRFEIARPNDSRRARLVRSLKTAMRVQWAVTLALTPLTLLLFYQVSIISPIANAIAIPLVSFVVTPLSLAGAVLPALIGAGLLHAANGLVVLLAAWLAWLSAAPVAVWAGPAPRAWAFVCAMIGAAWWLAPRGVPSRWLGAFWMIPMFAWPADRPAIGSARLTALDIGQGTSVLIETHATRVLYDTGPQYAPDNDAGNRIIVPFLRARGIARLDAMIVSHNDSDHSGGALSILQAMPVDVVRSSLAYESPIVRASKAHRRCLAGQRWTSDGVSFELMHPLPDAYALRDGKPPVKPNAKSCVLRVEVGGHSMLLTADIEKPQEAELVVRNDPSLRADVLLVPHHGSRTSSSDLFLDATAPSFAIVQAGYLNRFGHPRPDVIARYAERAIPVLRNDVDGAITVMLDANGVSIARYRQEHPRYWYGR